VVEAAHKLGVKCATLGIGDDVFIEPFKNETKMQYFKEVLGKSDKLFFNAEYLGRESAKISGINIDYQVTYFGVDYNIYKPIDTDRKTALRQDFGFPESPLLILNVASPLVRKGWLDLLDAIAEIKKKRSDFKLVAGYAGPGDIDLPKEIKARNLDEVVIDYGEVMPSDLSRLYNSVDIFCLPSHWEGLPTVVMESMACGLPVISTPVCGIPEIVGEGLTGTLVPPKQPNELAQALLKLMDDEALRITYGHNAREFIVNKWGNANENSAKLMAELAKIM
jgi:glycosyltransferase involved in cell wall biosynthesis